MEDNFFIIDSDNLDRAEQRFYGYSIVDDKVVFDMDSDDYSKLSGIGAYVFVNVGENEISIAQDYTGSYGLYIYRQDEYFAISNSFLKLLEYLRDNRRNITFNRSFADYYMATKMSVNIYSQTLINEIEMLPINVEIVIDKSQGSVMFNEIDYEEHTVDVNSKEALDILDEWFERWVDVLRDIRRKTNNLRMDLSGGFDSRAASVIWLCANIDLDNVMVNSSIRESDAEDYEISSQIAEEFGFELNNRIGPRFTAIRQKDFINNYNYVKFGFEKQIFWRNYEYETPMFRLSGHCGETIRSYVNQTPEEYRKSMTAHARFFSPELAQSVDKLLADEFKNLSEEYGIDENSLELSELLYIKARNRNHFGKEFVTSYIYNFITIAPLSDPVLQKINFKIGVDDDLLLVALILSRYCPKLLDFDFDSNKHIRKETLDACRKINSINPFEIRQMDKISGPEVVQNGDGELPGNNIFSNIQKVFNSRDFEMEFCKIYSRHLYDTIRLDSNRYRKNRYDIYSAVDIVKTIHDVNIANSINDSDYGSWIENHDTDSIIDRKIEASEILNNYIKARVDIKNNGDEGNDIEILENSDVMSKVTSPKWLKTDTGTGYVLTSNELALDLKIRAIKDGKLTVKLRGTLLKDKNNRTFPAYIDFTSLKVGDDEKLTRSRLVNHDEPYVFEMDVGDSEIVLLHIEWFPFTDSSVYETRKLDELKDEIRQLKRENSKLKQELENSSQEKSNKLLRKLRF